MNNRKLMVIGWDAADWKIIDRLIGQGKMPTLKKFLSEGVHGKIKTLDPPLSPMLWTSMATGFRADKHGVTGFVEPTPEGNAIRPVTSTSRKVKAIWNIMSQNGKKSNVVSWWPTNPVEPINGCMVSNLYQVTNNDIENWTMPAGTIHPERLEETLKNYRVHLNEITSAIVRPFVPAIEDITDDKHKETLGKIAKVIAEMSSVHAASTYLQENEQWDFMAVYHDAIDHFSHLCMRFYPPQLPNVPDEVYKNYNVVVEAGYMFQDMMLERTLSMLDDNTAVIIVSDHGFHSDHLRPGKLYKEMAAPAREHSPYGIFCMKGPGIKKEGQIFGASVIDITPTILAYYGLPVGEDMEGRVLDQCFEEEINVEFIPSWERVSGDSGQHIQSDIENTWESHAAMQQLIELGYVEEIGEDLDKHIKTLSRESRYYVARNLLDGQKVPEAIEILLEVYEESEENRYGQRLALAYLLNKEYGKCESLINEIRERNKEKLESDEWDQEDDKTKLRFKNPELEVPNYIDFVEGMLNFNMNRLRKSIEFFDKVLERNKGSVVSYLYKGRAFLRLQQWENAKVPLIQSLAINELSPVAHYSLGLANLRTGEFELAADEFLAAIELDYNKASYHYHFGETLFKLDKIEAAESAFKIALAISPGMTKAHKWMISLYEEHLNKPDLAQKHKEFIKENIREEIIVVSGLPRSGTSMMMQMLHAGGVDPLVDGSREADNNNPKGYYELEKVKGLMRDQSWLPEAEGKAIKVITQLVPHLSPEHNYRIVYMDRDIVEVLVSQQKMLGKTAHVNAKVFPTGLDQAFKKQVAKMNSWVESQPNVNILNINYKDVIENPLDNATKISHFLGKELDVQLMVEAVDPTLHRNKLG
ncbi:MAG: putative AlkP superfamily phosphohydrolase/phosphomutase/tetratricopeptide (TPR) repeat protein [Parvicellaceae bacterium]|jgi:predicted AlkP superfamily phosphohydrolase/phosphomutase/tetratricopeptide (TPR) repeat protein